MTISLLYYISIFHSLGMESHGLLLFILLAPYESMRKAQLRYKSLDLKSVFWTLVIHKSQAYKLEYIRLE